MRRIVWAAAMGLGVGWASAAEDGTFPVASNLKAAAAKVDITPPPDTPVTGHPRKTSGVRDPIRAGVLLLDDGKTRAAIATFDLIAAGDGLVKSIREAIHLKTGTPRENILVAAFVVGIDAHRPGRPPDGSDLPAHHVRAGGESP